MPCVCRCLRSQKRVLDHLELDLQVIANFPSWVLGNKLRFSAKAASTPDTEPQPPNGIFSIHVLSRNLNSLFMLLGFTCKPCGHSLLAFHGYNLRGEILGYMATTISLIRK